MLMVEFSSLNILYYLRLELCDENAKEITKQKTKRERKQERERCEVSESDSHREKKSFKEIIRRKLKCRLS